MYMVYDFFNVPLNQFASILLRIFVSVSIRDMGVFCSFLFSSLVVSSMTLLSG